MVNNLEDESIVQMGLTVWKSRDKKIRDTVPLRVSTETWGSSAVDQDPLDLERTKRQLISMLFTTLL
jgi:hypothetical protein